MAFEGMDVDEVGGRILPQMTAMLQQLETVVNTMPGLVSDLEANWKGPDAAQFAANWPSHHAQITAAYSALQDMHSHTQVNLSAQQSASNSY
ncbi:MAG TPA: hypothetical protein VI365_26345 [Trebonia sp.]